MRTVTSVAMGAVVGFASAFILDQIKSGKDERRKVARLKTALYVELGELYTSLSLLSAASYAPSAKEDFRNMLQVIRMDAYDYARSNPDIFYLLPEARELLHIFTAVDFAKNHPGRPQDLAFAMAFPYVVQSAVKDKKIDVKEFKKAAPQAMHTIRMKMNLPDTEQS